MLLFFISISRLLFSEILGRVIKYFPEISFNIFMCTICIQFSCICFSFSIHMYIYLKKQTTAAVYYIVRINKYKLIQQINQRLRQYDCDNK